MVDARHGADDVARAGVLGHQVGRPPGVVVVPQDGGRGRDHAAPQVDAHDRVRVLPGGQVAHRQPWCRLALGQRVVEPEPVGVGRVDEHLLGRLGHQRGGRGDRCRCPGCRAPRPAGGRRPPRASGTSGRTAPGPSPCRRRRPGPSPRPARSGFPPGGGGDGVRPVEAGAGRPPTPGHGATLALQPQLQEPELPQLVAAERREAAVGLGQQRLDVGGLEQAPLLGGRIGEGVAHEVEQRALQVGGAGTGSSPGPVDDLGGDDAAGRVLEHALAPARHLELGRAGGGQRHEVLVQERHPGLQAQAIVMLSTRFTGSSTSMTSVSRRSARSSGVAAPGRPKWPDTKVPAASSAQRWAGATTSAMASSGGRRRPHRR